MLPTPPRPTLFSQPPKMVTSGTSPSDALQIQLTCSIWKSNASKKIGPISGKERQAIEYRQKLVEKWSTSKDVRSVAERRFVPSSIHNTTKLKRDMIESQKVKEDRRRAHTRAGKEKPKAERKSESFRRNVRKLVADIAQRLSSGSRSRSLFRHAFQSCYFVVSICTFAPIRYVVRSHPCMERYPMTSDSFQSVTHAHHSTPIGADQSRWSWYAF
jgi:WD repeat and SOF domain-containing protein 1